MSVVVSVGGTPLATTRIRLRGGGNVGISGLSSGANGEMEQGAITVEDITYDFDARGWQTVAVDETDTTTAPRLFCGFIADQTYSRGEHYRVADDRQIDLTINDTNVLLSNDLLLAADSPDRPAEDDAARIAWLLGTVPMSGRIFDLGLIDTIGEQYDATSFLHQSPADVLNDLCSARGNIFFTYWDQDAEQIGLFYDRPIDTTFTCTLTFSNDLDDLTIDGNGVVTGTCFPPYEGSAMLSDPSEIYCRVIYVYKGGAIAVHDDATHAAYLSSTGDGIPDAGHRTILVENDKVGRVTTATSFATRLLEHYSVERRTVTFTTRLHSTQVGLVQAGMRVGLKFTHLPELSTQQYFRIETLTLAPTEDEPDRAYWDAEITASVHGLGFAPGTGGGSTETFPPVPPAGACTSEGGNLAMGTTVTMDPGSNSTSSGVNGLTISGTLSGLAYWDNGASTSSNSSACCMNWWGGGPTWWQYNDDFGTPVSLARIRVEDSAGANNNYVGSSHGGVEIWASDDGTTYHKVVSVGEWSFVSGASWDVQIPFGDRTHRYWGFRFLEDFPGGGGGFWGGYETFGWATYECISTAPVPPKTGQPVGPETVTMSGPDGTTTYRFADGTLQVFVDNTDQTGAVIASDGAAGTFTLDFSPWPGEVVTVYYKAI